MNSLSQLTLVDDDDVSKKQAYMLQQLFSQGGHYANFTKVGSIDCY